MVAALSSLKKSTHASVAVTKGGAVALRRWNCFGNRWKIKNQRTWNLCKFLKGKKSPKRGGKLCKQNNRRKFSHNSLGHRLRQPLFGYSLRWPAVYEHNPLDCTRHHSTCLMVLRSPLLVLQSSAKIYNNIRNHIYSCVLKSNQIGPPTGSWWFLWAISWFWIPRKQNREDFRLVQKKLITGFIQEYSELCSEIFRRIYEKNLHGAAQQK